MAKDKTKTEGEVPILVEFSTQPGVQQVSLTNLWRRNREDLTEKSELVLERALGAVRNMAERLAAMHEDIPVEFSQVEVSFGIKLDWEVGPILAKAGTEASLNVKLTWERPEKPVPVLPSVRGSVEAVGSGQGGH